MRERVLAKRGGGGKATGREGGGRDREREREHSRETITNEIKSWSKLENIELY